MSQVAKDCRIFQALHGDDSSGIDFAHKRKVVLDALECPRRCECADSPLCLFVCTGVLNDGIERPG